MKKKLFAFFTLLIITTFFVSCPKQYGNMVLSIEADKTAIVAGETVKFSVKIPEKQEFKQGSIKILDGDTQQIAFMLLDEKLSFNYKFQLPDNYQVQVDVETNKDYGSAQTDIAVEYSGWQPVWSLKDSLNSTSLMGNEGESVNFRLDYFLAQKSVKSIDVRLINKDKKVIFYERDLKTGAFTYVHSADNGVGTVDFIITVNLNDGQSTLVKDQFVILDPNNPVKSLVNASVNDKNYPDQIYVDGTVELVGAEGTIDEIYLKRICYYGKENGVYALSEPKGDPSNGADTTFYSKVGKEIEKHEVIYELLKDGVQVENSLLTWSADDNKFTFVDPMPYFDENGAIVESEGFKWSYAKFDREAWKYIKRKKNFDLKKAVGVEYIICARATIAGETKEIVESAIATGIPYLSKIPMAQFCMWLKETAMNRLWHMQVPRYCYSKSSSWLTSAQDIKGNVSGNVYYTAGISGGGGAIKDYSDWPGLRIYTNTDIGISGISLKTNVRQTHGADLTIITPIWPQMRFVIDNIGVRDYTLQWGLWVDDGASGQLKLTRAGAVEEKVSPAEMASFMPTWKAGDWFSAMGYGYDEFDYTDAPDVKQHGSSWTKINFLYSPTKGNPVENGEWVNHGPDWSVKYIVE